MGRRRPQSFQFVLRHLRLGNEDRDRRVSKTVCERFFDKNSHLGFEGKFKEVLGHCEL